MCTLELLKQRFGDGSLHFCEVMLKDIGDSKRINSAILSKSSDSQEVILAHHVLAGVRTYVSFNWLQIPLCKRLEC